MSFTPGPWRIEQEPDVSSARLGIPAGYMVMGKDAAEDAEPDDQRVIASYCLEADARLIAAAPDLYDTCRQLVAFAERWEAGPIPQWLLDIVEAGKAAIQKAEGSTEGKTR
jgi:hypothetical protein